jgi:mannose-6-phosphate isomerase
LNKVITVKKPWGEEIIFAVNKNYAGKILRIAQGHRLSLQYHRKKDETLYLIKGSIRLTRGRNIHKLTTRVLHEGSVFHVPPKTIHRMEAIRGTELIEVSTPHLTDVVRLKDDYNRTSTSVKKKAK